MDGLNSPELAKLLINCLNCIDNHVKEIFTFNEEAKNYPVKVTESLEFMSAKFDNLENEIQEKDERINQLEKTIENLAGKQKSHSSETDDSEKYSQRNCLVLHCVNESNDENTNKIIIKTFSAELQSVTKYVRQTLVFM